MVDEHCHYNLEKSAAPLAASSWIVEAEVLVTAAIVRLPLTDQLSAAATKDVPVQVAVHLHHQQRTRMKRNRHLKVT